MKNETRINAALAQLDKKDKARHATAVKEGHRDEVCSECKGVFLAFHHFIRCDSESCPMKSRGPDGKSPSVLEMLLKQE